MNPIKFIEKGQRITVPHSRAISEFASKGGKSLIAYQMHVRRFFHKGKLEDTLKLSFDYKETRIKFIEGAKNLLKLSLGSGYIVREAAPHLMIWTFNNIAKINAEAGIKIAIPMPIKPAQDAQTPSDALESYDHLFKESEAEQTPQWIIEGLG